MDKVYVLSKHPDREVEEAIYNLSIEKARVALYMIARGNSFDTSMDVAVFIGEDVKESWIKPVE